MRAVLDSEGVMKASEYSRLVGKEIAAALAETDNEQIEKLLDMIQEADRVFVAGAGRSGFMMRAFAMRLMHLGLAAFVVGESTTPAIGVGDLLVAGSGSGQTKMTLAIVEAAATRGARTAVITAHPASPIALACDHVVQLHTPITSVDKERPSRQPPGSLFEQCLLAQCDATILMLMSRLGTTEEHMRQRHTKLE